MISRSFSAKANKISKIFRFVTEKRTAQSQNLLHLLSTTRNTKKLLQKGKQVPSFMHSGKEGEKI